jgi:hypothetical protein
MQSGVASGATSIAAGGSAVAAGVNSRALGSNCTATANDATSIGNTNIVSGAGAVGIGQNLTVSAANAVGLGYQGKSAASWATHLGGEGNANHVGEVAIGHGRFPATVGGAASAAMDGTAQSSIIGIYGQNDTNGAISFASAVSGTAFVVPTNSIWTVRGAVNAVRRSDQSCLGWIFHCMVRNIGGVATIIGDIMGQDDTGAWVATASGAALPYTFHTAAPESLETAVATLVVDSTAGNLRIQGDSNVNFIVNWSGTLIVTQTGWYT